MTTLGDLIATGTRSTVHALGTDMVAKVPLATTPDAWIRHEAMYTQAVRAAGAPAPRVVSPSPLIIDRHPVVQGEVRCRTSTT